MVLFFTVLINFCSTFLVHPVYVSMTNMDVDANKGNIILSIRIFTDDLETVLHHKYNVDGWIGTPKEHREGRRLLKEYVNERFSIMVNNSEKIDLQTDSVTIMDDTMWFYMNGNAQKTIRHIEINNRLLTDFFSNQTNLVIINNKTGKKLNRKNYKLELSFLENETNH